VPVLGMGADQGSATARDFVGNPATAVMRILAATSLKLPVIRADVHSRRTPIPLKYG